MANLERWAPMYRRRSAWEETGDMMTQLSSLYQMLLTQRQQQMQAWETKRKIEIEEQRMIMDEWFQREQIGIKKEELGVERKRVNAYVIAQMAEASASNALARLHEATTRVKNAEAQNMIMAGLYQPISMQLDLGGKTMGSLSEMVRESAETTNRSRVRLLQQSLGGMVWTSDGQAVDWDKTWSKKIQNDDLNRVGETLVKVKAISKKGMLMDLLAEDFAQWLASQDGMDFQASGGLANAGMLREKLADQTINLLIRHPKLEGKVIPGVGVGGKKPRADARFAINSDTFIGLERELLEYARGINRQAEYNADLDRMRQTFSGLAEASLSFSKIIAGYKGDLSTEEGRQELMYKLVSEVLIPLEKQNIMFETSKLEILPPDESAKEKRMEQSLQYMDVWRRYWDAQMKGGVRR